MAFPTTFPSFWTQADIDRYRETWQIREAQGLVNPEPWWIGNPEWSEGPLKLLPGSPTAVISSPGIIPGSGEGSPGELAGITPTPPIPGAGEGSPGELAGVTPTKYASMDDLKRLGLVSGKETDANLAITQYSKGFISGAAAGAAGPTKTGTGDLIGLGVLAIVGLGLAGAGRSRTRYPRTRTRTRARSRRKRAR